MLELNQMGRKPYKLIFSSTLLILIFVAFVVNFVIVLISETNSTTQKITTETTENTMKDNSDIAPDEILDDIATGEAETEPILPDKIDLQPIVDKWASTTGGNRSVLIYDLDRDEYAAKYNENEDYNTASLYKLFVVYEGCRRLENGTWQADERVNYLGQTVLECLDLAIRESNSTCAEPLWAKIGHAELDNIIKTDFGILNSKISSLVSNPKDILAIMKIFYEHKDLKNEDYIAKMKDSFLNQPITQYNWRQGLPSGFSDKTKVYNKVGWAYNAAKGYWDIYHDAAIIETESGRHFIVVVMTNRVSYITIKNLGTEIEKALQ